MAEILALEHVASLLCKNTELVIGAHAGPGTIALCFIGKTQA